MNRNPLIATVADTGVSELRNILQSAVDGPAVVAALRTYLQTNVEDEAIKQILGLFRMVKITSEAESTLIDAAISSV